MVVVKLIGVVILMAVVAVAALIGDLAWNGGRVLYALMGRDSLVSRCTPPLGEDLTRRGFSPTDLAMSGSPSINITPGTRTFGSAFTFSDGQDGPRVDGRLVCTVSGSTVKVDVDVDGLPKRAA